MNAITRSHEHPAQRAFTVDDIYRMTEVGILTEDENVELIEGEVVYMAAKNHIHERVKSAITLAVARALPDDLWLGIESSIQLSDLSLVEPDLAIYPRHFNLRAVRGPDLLLAIEVADTSFSFDRGRKAQLYARSGVQELWVVEANSRTTFVHRTPTTHGWSSIEELPATAALVPRYPGLSAVSIRLADWD